jgi:sigma-E factor negative regulatory protein RseC
MAKAQLVTHRGLVEHITPESIVVRIGVESLCAACHAKSVCGVADAGEKRIEAPNRGQAVQQGDEVNVVLRAGIGLRAVWWAYVCPLVVLLFILLLLQAAQCPDLYIGLAALAALAVYYGALYGFRGELKKTYTFEIENIT